MHHVLERVHDRILATEYFPLRWERFLAIHYRECTVLMFFDRRKFFAQTG